MTDELKSISGFLTSSLLFITGSIMPDITPSLKSNVTWGLQCVSFGVAIIVGVVTIYYKIKRNGE